MRYHQKSFGWCLASAVLWALLAIMRLWFGSHHSLANNLMAALFSFVFILEIATYQFIFFQVLDLEFVERRLWRKKVQPYQAITYVGPPTGKWTKRLNWDDSQVEIRTGNDIQSLVMPAKRKAFLADLHKHLSEEVFYFDKTPS